MPNWGQLLSEDGGLPPPRVPGYTVLELIGGHGQSEVYLAEDLKGRRVALKRWKLPSPRAQLELEALQSLRVPGVVAVLGSSEDQALGLPCLIMEYVEAPHLLAETPRLEPRAAAAVVRDVARTLRAVHAQELVHRDIKPANILLRENGSVVLVDFGVVKSGQSSDSQAGLTMTGAGPIGTLPYMAPEQLDLLEDAVGPQADVYALGATLYQCLTGVVPFETNGAFERRERQVWKDPPPGAHIEGVPPQLQRAVSACLAFRPQDRPQGVEAVASALDDFLAGRSDRAAGGQALLVGVALVAVALAGVALASVRGPGPDATSPTSPATPLASPTQSLAPGPLQTLLLQPGPRAGRDTYVSSVGLYTNDNFGPAPNLRIGFRVGRGQRGEYRALLAFDLSQVPEGAESISAQLELYSRGAGPDPGPETIEVRPILPSGERTPWLEGTGRNDSLLDGVAWNGVARTRHPAASSNLPQRSLPRVGELASTAQVTSGHIGWISFDLSDCVRAWVADPPSNLGVVLSSPGDPRRGSWRLASSDTPDPALHPRLRLSYRGPPPLERVVEDAALLRRRAERALEEGARAAKQGDLRAAHEAVTQAAVHCPGWGRPYFERALLAERFGAKAMVRIDLYQSQWALEPEPRARALLLLARANLREVGLTSRRIGLVLLTVLCLDPEVGPEARRLFPQAYANLSREDLSSPAIRERGLIELTQFLATRERIRARPKPGELALRLGLAIACEVAGDPRALTLYQEASAAAPSEPLVLALTGGRQRTSPRAAAARVRILLALGERKGAERQLRAASSRWPESEDLIGLRDLLGPG